MEWAEIGARRDALQFRDELRARMRELRARNGHEFDPRAAQEPWD